MVVNKTKDGQLDRQPNDPQARKPDHFPIDKIKVLHIDQV
jgi:hypothetical protein